MADFAPTGYLIKGALDDFEGLGDFVIYKGKFYLNGNQSALEIFKSKVFTGSALREELHCLGVLASSHRLRRTIREACWAAQLAVTHPLARTSDRV
jgi:hypothetical protein